MLLDSKGKQIAPVSRLGFITLQSENERFDRAFAAPRSGLVDQFGRQLTFASPYKIGDTIEIKRPARFKPQV